MKQMRLRDIPDELHTRFKMMCVRDGITMNDRILRLMSEAVEEGAAQLGYDAPSLGKSIADAVKKGPVKDE